MHHLTKTLTALAMFAALILFPATWAVAGDLEPSSGPASSMKTLQQIWDKLECSPAPCPNPRIVVGVPKTGQIISYRDRDDGELQKGKSVTPRYLDNGDGTVTDNLTNLMWVKDPQLLPGNDTKKNWNESIDFCNTLEFAEYTDWYLPNIKQLQSLIDFSRNKPALPLGHPFSSIQSDRYWSSTTVSSDTTYALLVDMSNGFIYSHWKPSSYSMGYVIPVRDI